MLNFKGKPLHLPDFDTIIAVNLRGTVDVIRQFVPHIAKNKPLGSKPAASSLAASDIGDGERGVVVMVSSIAAVSERTLFGHQFPSLLKFTT